MREAVALDAVSVECYSGACYAERPVALTWRGERLSVESIERAYQTPAGRVFVVRTAGGRRFRLSYQDGEDRWEARPLPDAHPLV